jgi:acyl carrier protein
MSQYQQPILDYISGVAAEAGGGPVALDTPLLEAGVLDSINLVRLVQFVEERFGLKIPDDHLGPEFFESAASVAAYVAAHKG